MHVPAPTSRLRFGLGLVQITPPVGIYHRMWGEVPLGPRCLELLIEATAAQISALEN